MPMSLVHHVGGLVWWCMGVVRVGGGVCVCVCGCVCFPFGVFHGSRAYSDIVSLCSPNTHARNACCLFTKPNIKHVCVVACMAAMHACFVLLLL